ncbi:MAG: DUF402 domain-containing protein [Acidimicrobiales bacterium]
MKFADEMLLRYVYDDGSPMADFPMRVVEDASDRLVAWLAPGSEIRYWATAEGRDPRTLPLDRRFRSKMTAARRTWQGPGVLRVIFDDTIYHVIHFWTPEGKFAGWYINFESPSRRHGNQVLTFDWQLDLWITPEGTGQWKDEDEAAAAIDAGMLTREELADSFAAGQEILDNFAAFLERAGDWREWSAPSSWTAMQLPF